MQRSVDWNFLDVSTLDFNCQKTWDMLCAGNTAGVFQLESTGMTDTCIRLQPRQMSDLIALLSLYRPDTMSELEHYIKRKNGEEEITYLHPDLEPILKETYGCLIYQEQLMKISKVFAGYSDAEADDFRKGIGKKNPELVKAQAEKFRIRAIEKGYPEDVVNEIADELAKKGGYMFNKSHATGYAITSFKTAYLKANHPIIFMCSLISNQKKEDGATDYESIGRYVLLCKGMGISVANPDINKSAARFFSVEGDIIYGFNLLKGVGDNTVEAILKYRPFEDYNDFMIKVGSDTSINKTSVVSLIKSGCFDFSGASRSDLLLQYCKYRYDQGKDKLKALSTINKNHIQELLDAKIIKPNETEDRELCLTLINQRREAIHMKEWEETVMVGDEFTWEFQTLSNHLKGDPFEGYSFPKWDSYEDESSAMFFGTVVTITKKKIKKGRSAGQQMAFIEFSTQEGIREATCFSDLWARIQDRLDKGSLVVCKGTKQGEKCILTGALPFETWKIENGG